MSEIVYKSDTRLYYKYATNTPYSGYGYNVRNNNSDTALLNYYSQGRLVSSRVYYSNDKLQSKIDNYYFGLRADSICSEQLTLNARGDTTSYFVQYIDKNKVKWGKQLSYYGAYADKKPPLMSITLSRYFTKKESAKFADPSYRLDVNFDSAGYSVFSAQAGLFIQYSDKGKVLTRGQNGQYGYCISHNGHFPQYPATGRVGTWYSYNSDGSKAKEEYYDANGMSKGYAQFYADGKVSGKYSYRECYRNLHVTSPAGINVRPQDSVTVVSSTWSNSGVLTQQMFYTTDGSTVSSSYNMNNGLPVSFTAYTPYQKPFGIHKTWDGQGHVLQFTNYSVEENDTLSYVSHAGKITAVSLRDRSEPLNWDKMPYNYYYYWPSQGNQSINYLAEKINTYQEFYGNGQMKKEVHLKRGERNGLYREWDSLGVQMVNVYFVNDLAVGHWKEWYSNGQLKKDYYYVSGIRSDVCTDYYSSGAIKWQNTYTDGVPGIPRSYSENGTNLNAQTWLSAFYSPNCIKNQSAAIIPTALHYYFLDTTAAKTLVTIPDSLVENYSSKVVAAFISATPNYDPCGQASTLPATAEFDAYHSCFIISESIYDAKAKAVMNAFFSRHGITIDNTGTQDEPLLGLEKEYKIYYSSKEILNKAVVIDSLEALLAPQSGDGKKGYILALDSYQPAAPVIGGGKSSTMTSANGYTIISVISSAYQNSVAPQDMTTIFIVYDDLSCDVQSRKMQGMQVQYWPH